MCDPSWVTQHGYPAWSWSPMESYLAPRRRLWVKFLGAQVVNDVVGHDALDKDCEHKRNILLKVGKSMVTGQHGHLSSWQIPSQAELL